MWLPDDPQALRGCTVVVLAVPEMHLVLLADLHSPSPSPSPSPRLGAVLAVLAGWLAPALCCRAPCCLLWAQGSNKTAGIDKTLGR